MMKVDRESPSAKGSFGKKTRLADADDEILSAFDPVVEGSTFHILEVGLDPQEFASIANPSDLTDAPEVLATFDLAEALARVPEKLFFRIGEVGDLLDVKTYVLRFWETEFPMVSPSKSRSGQRVYRKKDVEMLLLIKHLLYVERFSIEGARKRIREFKLKPADHRTKGATEKKSMPSPTRSVDRESLRGKLLEIEQLAKAELSKFFRF